MRTSTSQGYIGRGRRLPALRLRGAVMMAALAVGVAAAGGCGESDDGSEKATGSTSDPGVRHAREELAKARESVAWEPPGPAFDASNAKGKKVLLAVIDMSFPVEQVHAEAFQEAMNSVGVDVQVCDGRGDPSQWRSCADQAVNRNYDALGIVAIPPDIVAPALARAKQKDIPVISINNSDPTGPLAANVDGLVSHPYTYGARLMADQVIADSNGDTGVLVLSEPDGFVSQLIVDKGLKPEFEERCPKCKVTYEAMPFAQQSTQLGPTAQAILAREPSIEYVIPIYDVMATWLFPAIRQAGATDRIKIVSMNGQLEPMQQLAAGELMTMDVVNHFAWEGFASADQTLRLLAGEPPLKDAKVPIRVFDSGNIDSIDLNQNAAFSGEWLGDPQEFRAGYEELWAGQ